jgi:hypothetical protein
MPQANQKANDYFKLLNFTNSRKLKTDEFFARMKNGANPLDEINRRTAGENK